MASICTLCNCKNNSKENGERIEASYFSMATGTNHKIVNEPGQHLSLISHPEEACTKDNGISKKKHDIPQAGQNLLPPNDDNLEPSYGPEASESGYNTDNSDIRNHIIRPGFIIEISNPVNFVKNFYNRKIHKSSTRTDDDVQKVKIIIVILAVFVVFITTTIAVTVFFWNRDKDVTLPVFPEVNTQDGATSKPKIEDPFWFGFMKRQPHPEHLTVNMQNVLKTSTDHV